MRNFNTINYFSFSRITGGCLALFILLTACKQEYYPPVPDSNTKLLVVEGFLNGGAGPTTIRLSRTTNLTDTAVKKVETGAQVIVEGENGSNFILTGNNQGEYINAQLNLVANVRYRLHIKTREGKEYVSDYTSLKYTPAIDSITWIRENDGLRLYVNTHDPQNATRYYQWEFEETWEFRSRLFSNLKYLKDNTGKNINVVYRDPLSRLSDTTIYKCWKTLNSTSIIIGSSERLTNDVIYSPVNFIEGGSEKLDILYSINLKQYAVSHEKYLFLQKMKRNTEQVGTLFDAQPSQLSGNVHNISDPNEPVIGFVEISEQKTKRVFIYNSQVPDWNFRQFCEEFNIKNHPDTIATLILYPTTPAETDFTGAIILRFFATYDLKCIDCREGGRTNQRPLFWP